MIKKRSALILSIETSCDETAAAVLEMRADGSTKTLSSIIKSQISLHSKMGGVVPEVAARAHVKNILPTVEKTLTDAKVELPGIDYIAVTQGPGLIPSLIVGVEFAKALSMATGKPIIPVNHMLGHLYSPFKQNTKHKSQINNLFPMIALIVSGGHTMLVLMKSIKDYKVLGQTVDDAAGEAFDKVAKMLKLPYPGGPEVSKLAEKGNPDFQLPRPMITAKNYNFSFSGLKTAVLYRMRDFPKTKPADICKAFQDATIDVLVIKTLRAVKEFNAKSISVSGGVSANEALREKLKIKSEKLKVEFFIPNTNLRTDNAEMIALAGAFMLKNGYKSKKYSQIKADSNLSL